MKTIWLLGLLSLLLLVVYSKVAGAPSGAVHGPERPVAMTAPLVMQVDDILSERLSEYVFLHQTRHESIPVHAMAGAATCR